MSNWIFPTFLILAILVLSIKLSRKKTYAELLLFQIKMQEEKNVTSQRFYLETMRRELANIIMSENLEIFEKVFSSMCDFEKEIGSANKIRRAAEYTILLEKYPNLQDFDIIGTRHFIRYKTDSSTYNTEGLIERYKDISKFMIVDRIFALQTEGQQFYDDKEREIFRKGMRDEKNQRLRLSLKEGMRRYYARLPADSEDYDDLEFNICGIPSLPDNRYGIFCKKLNEFGIYSFFSDGEKGYDSYYRSNQDFSLEGDSIYL